MGVRRSPHASIKAALLQLQGVTENQLNDPEVIRVFLHVLLEVVSALDEVMTRPQDDWSIHDAITKLQRDKEKRL